MFRGDLDEVPGEIVWDDYTVDDLIDSVCEWNYELILDIDAERMDPKDMSDFSDKQDKYEQLKKMRQYLISFLTRQNTGPGLKNLRMSMQKGISKAPSILIMM